MRKREEIQDLIQKQEETQVLVNNSSALYLNYIKVIQKKSSRDPSYLYPFNICVTDLLIKWKELFPSIISNFPYMADAFASMEEFDYKKVSSWISSNKEALGTFEIDLKALLKNEFLDQLEVLMEALNQISEFYAKCLRRLSKEKTESYDSIFRALESATDKYQLQYMNIVMDNFLLGKKLFEEKDD